MDEDRAWNERGARVHEGIERMKQLALFDLDFTLLPLDSDYEFGRFLGRIGAVDAKEHERRNAAFFEQYKAGTLDIRAYLEFALKPLVGRSEEELRGWQNRFMAEVIEPSITQQALSLIDGHRGNGDLCAIVTATNDFVTTPIARRLDVEHLIATRAGRDERGFTGAGTGQPSYREGKIARVDEWLASLGTQWDAFDRTWFYSDSHNDLPLLERASDPVAINPDATLRAIAQARGWRVQDLFDA